MTDIIETMIPHGKRRADGRERRNARFCPGMWVIEYDERGLTATCNECETVRNLTEYLDPIPAETK